MIKRTAENFSSFALFHPSLNLSEKLKKSSLSQEVSPSAASFFESSRINPKHFDENARDLDKVNPSSLLGLLRLVPLRPTADVQIFQGNQRLPN